MRIAAEGAEDTEKAEEDGFPQAMSHRADAESPTAATDNFSSSVSSASSAFSAATFIAD